MNRCITQPAWNGKKKEPVKDPIVTSHVKLHSSLVDKISAIAKEHNCSFSEVTEKLIKYTINQIERKKSPQGYHLETTVMDDKVTCRSEWVKNDPKSPDVDFTKPLF